MPSSAGSSLTRLRAWEIDDATKLGVSVGSMAWLRGSEKAGGSERRGLSRNVLAHVLHLYRVVASCASPCPPGVCPCKQHKLALANDDRKQAAVVGSVLGSLAVES